MGSPRSVQRRVEFCNLDEMETHGQKVQNKGANGEESGDKETQAMILVMVVDQNGKDFAKLKSYMKLLIFDERCIWRKGK